MNTINKTSKQLIALTLALSMLILSPATAFAGNTSEFIEGDFTFQFEYTRELITGLSIQSGTAYVSGSLYGYMGITDKVKIYLYLEKKVGTSWEYEKMFYGTFNSHRGTVTGNYDDLDAGSQYRVRGVYYAYDGTAYETITDYSSTRTA